MVPQEVLFVMGARLVQIDERWKDGGLQKAGLSSDEVVHLVRLFQMLCFHVYIQLRMTTVTYIMTCIITS